MVVSALIQFILTLRLASLRRTFAQTVSGTVVMPVAVTAIPFIISRAVIPPVGQSAMFFLAPGMAALAAGVLMALQYARAWNMWVRPITVTVGGLWPFPWAATTPVR